MTVECALRVGSSRARDLFECKFEFEFELVNTTDWPAIAARWLAVRLMLCRLEELDEVVVALDPPYIAGYNIGLCYGKWY